jgi:hypothetical protein
MSWHEAARHGVAWGGLLAARRLVGDVRSAAGETATPKEKKAQQKSSPRLNK